MNVFALLRLLGEHYLSGVIKSGLDHHFSADGLTQLATNLDAASTALKAGDHQAAADALATVVVSIH